MMITGFRNSILVGRFLIVCFVFALVGCVVFTELWLFRCLCVCF